jgi:DNA (cytosine-5)-methyltransferase 1
MKHDIFTIYKNYEISNSKMSDISKNSVWVLRSKNICTDEPKIKHISNYDRYASKEIVKATKFYNFINTANEKLFLIPTLTYYPRVIEMPKDVFVNGSILVAQLKDPSIILRDKDLEFFYSNEFREFYSVAFNHATRTLNIDSDTIKFFGVVR